MSGAEALTKIATFAAFAYLARLFGPAGYGYIEWAGTVLMCSSLIVDQGFSSYGAREIARAPDETANLVSEVVTARIILAVISYAAIFIFAFYFVRESTITNLLLVYGLSLWALPFLLQWVFQGHDRMHIVGITQIVRQMTFVLVIFAFVRSLDNVLWVGIAEIAGVTAAALISIWAYRRYFSGRESFRWKLSPKLFREGVPIGLSQMFWTIKMFGATFVVGLVATSEETGCFAGAMRIYIALHTFVYLYYFNMLPSLSRAWEQGPNKLAGLIGRSLKIVASGSVVVGIIWVAMAPIVMRGAYGVSFAGGAGALQWLAGACIAAAISGHFRFGLIAARFQKFEMFATGFGSVVALVLIPIGYSKAGTSGAAAALFFAEIVVLVASWLFYQRALFSKPMADSRDAEEPIDGLRRAAL